MARVNSPETTPGRVAAISVSKRRGTPKTNVASAMLVPDWGIEGDAHAGHWHRQVSFLALESIAKMRAKGLNVDPGAFAENITTEFIDVPHLRVGDRVRIAGTELEVTQIGKECHSRCAIFEAAGDCVMPREGVFGRVVTGGPIRVGDEVRILHAMKQAAPDESQDGKSHLAGIGDRP
jgi:MOSC domain-containing protein YiiM